MQTPRTPTLLTLCSLLALGTAAACRQAEEPARETATSRLEPAQSRLSGNITLDGSNSVFPVSEAMAAAFQRENPDVRITVRVSGTGGGFEKFCSGQLDIVDASRPINAREAAACKEHNLTYIELPIAFDSLSVVVSSKNSFVKCLTLAELRHIWEPAAEGKLLSWNQVRPGFPNEPLALFGKGKESGTFDYFTLAVVGTESSSRGDYTKTEDDALIGRSVAADPHALGYFGYAKYRAHEAELSPVAIDAGKGCVLPNAATVSDGSYQPLSRPMFLYVSQAAAARPEVARFAHFYVAPENAKIVSGVGYVPLSPVSLLAADSRLARGVVGSALGAHGSVIGVRLDGFEDEDRVQSALVQ